jgi:hypothetical protein
MTLSAPSTTASRSAAQRGSRWVQKNSAVACLAREVPLPGGQGIGRQPGTPHLPAGEQITAQHQVGHAAGVGPGRRIGAVAHQELHHLGVSAQCIVQAGGQHARGVARMRGQFLPGRAHALGEAPGQRTCVAQGLAADEVVGLDRRRALVDGQDARVAVMLGGAGFLDEAHAAVHLHAQRGHLEADLGAEALDHRHQELVVRRMFGAPRRIGLADAQVVPSGGHQGQRPRTLGKRAHGHEHAAHVGVVHDGRGLARAGRARLHPLARVGRGLLVRTLGQSHPLHAHGVARGVHHDEHELQAASGLAHHLGDGAGAHVALVVAVQQHRGRTRLDAQLVLQRGTPHVVAPAVVEHLGGDEQRNALDPGGRVRQAREHQVDDVVRHVVLAVGDEDLLPEQPVASVVLRHGARAHQREVGSGLGLGQVHRAGPLARHQARQVARLLLRRPGGEQGLDGPVGEQRAQREAQVGAVEHFVAGGADQLGQALPSMLLRVLQPLPAALGETRVGLAKARRGAHRAVVPGRGPGIAATVQRRHDLAREPRALVEHRRGRLGIRAGLAVGGRGRDLVQPGKLAEHEQHVLHRGVVVTHRGIQQEDPAGIARPGGKVRARPPSRARR